MQYCGRGYRNMLGQNPSTCFTEYFLYKQIILYGFVVQMVRMPACHAGGHGFESRQSRQYAELAQLVEPLTCNE